MVGGKVEVEALETVVVILVKGMETWVVWVEAKEKVKLCVYHNLRSHSLMDNPSTQSQVHHRYKHHFRGSF